MNLPLNSTEAVILKQAIDEYLTADLSTTKNSYDRKTLLREHPLVKGLLEQIATRLTEHEALVTGPKTTEEESR